MAARAYCPSDVVTRPTALPFSGTSLLLEQSFQCHCPYPASNRANGCAWMVSASTLGHFFAAFAVLPEVNVAALL